MRNQVARLSVIGLAALFAFVAAVPASAQSGKTGPFVSAPKIDSVGLRCHYTGPSRDLVRIDARVRHSDVIRKAGYPNRFLKVRSRIRVETGNGRKLAGSKSSGRLRTGVRGQVIKHRYHGYLNRRASARILRYIGAGDDCERKVRWKRKVTVRVRTSQILSPTATAAATLSGPDGASTSAVVARGVRSADPPLFRAPILSNFGGTSGFGLAIGRFTKLPIEDVAINNVDQRTVSVLLGTGAGSYVPAAGSPISMGPHPNGPTSIVDGDFNGDGRQDLAVGIDIGTLHVLLGNGDGTFRPAAGSPFGSVQEPQSMATGDLNGDGKLDIAIAASFANTVSIMLGDGKGGFSQAAGSPIASGLETFSVAVGQFTAIPKLDLVAANREGGTVSVLLGSGTGQFGQAPGSPISVGSSPNSIAVGDMNSDGRQDLVFSQQDASQIMIKFGDGAGGFSDDPKSPYPVGKNPAGVVVGDLNQDDRPDLASSGFDSNNVTVLLNQGAGSGFSPAPGSPFAAGPDPQSMEIADLNADGRPDLGVVNYRGQFATLLNNG